MLIFTKSLHKTHWLLTVTLQVTFLLLCNESTTRLASGQLEAVGAVMSVVPVTNILATAGLMGVKLVAISRLLQMLGYDRAYLASGGSGSPAQPIGLQTKYAYMFPYVPGLNISVKGEHNVPFDKNMAALGPQQQLQQQPVQLPVAEPVAEKPQPGPDPGKGATRKTYPAMALPGDYENQVHPFRGGDMLQKIFRDAGLKIHIPTSNGLPNRGNVPHQQPMSPQYQQDPINQQPPNRPNPNVVQPPVGTNPGLASIMAASIESATNPNQLRHPSYPAPVSSGFDQQQPSSSSYLPAQQPPLPKVTKPEATTPQVQPAPPPTVHFHHPQTSQHHSARPPSDSQQQVATPSTSSTSNNINSHSPSSQVNMQHPNESQTQSQSQPHQSHPQHHPSRFSPHSPPPAPAQNNGLHYSPGQSDDKQSQQVAAPSRRKPTTQSLFPPLYKWQHPDPNAQLLQHYPIPQHEAYYLERMRQEAETRRKFEEHRLRDQQQPHQPPVQLQPPPRLGTTKVPAVQSGSLIPAGDTNSLDFGDLFDDFSDIPKEPTTQTGPTVMDRAPSQPQQPTTTTTVSSDQTRPSPINTNTNIVDPTALSPYSDGHSPPYYDELDDQNRTPFFARF